MRGHAADLAALARLPGRKYILTNAPVAYARRVLGVRGMAPLCDGEVIYFSFDPECPALAAHREAGKRAVIARYGQIMLASGQGEVALTRLADVPLTQGGQERQQVENVLAAVAAAWSLDISLDVMRTGIETFFAD